MRVDAVFFGENGIFLGVTNLEVEHAPKQCSTEQRLAANQDGCAPGEGALLIYVLEAAHARTRS